MTDFVTDVYALKCDVQSLNRFGFVHQNDDDSCKVLTGRMSASCHFIMQRPKKSLEQQKKFLSVPGGWFHSTCFNAYVVGCLNSAFWIYSETNIAGYDAKVSFLANVFFVNNPPNKVHV